MSEIVDRARRAIEEARASRNGTVHVLVLCEDDFRELGAAVSEVIADPVRCAAAGFSGTDYYGTRFLGVACSANPVNKVSFILSSHPPDEPVRLTILAGD